MSEDKNLTSMSEFAQEREMRRGPAPRVMNFFTVPPEIVLDSGVAEIGIVELTLNEEMTASKRAGVDMVAMAAELAKEALREVDGRTLSTPDLSADAFWRDCKPKLRQLILTAYNVVHNPGAANTAAFLSSRRQSAR